MRKKENHELEDELDEDVFSLSRGRKGSARIAEDVDTEIILEESIASASGDLSLRSEKEATYS